MFATIVQKWNAFKADWLEYKRLRRVAARAWRKLHHIRGKITMVYSARESAQKKSCIQTNFVNVPSMNASDELGLPKMNIIAYESYCPRFRGDDNDGCVAPCTETSCPCYAGHCEYVAASEEYATAAARRRAFWNNNAKAKIK